MIVCFGDSITAGQHVEPDKAWPSLLRGDVIAAGVPGETTRQALERFPRVVQDSGADAVVIQFGHNDCNRWQTDQGLPRVSELAFMANLEEMIERARNFAIAPLLCSLTPSRRSEAHALDCFLYDMVVREVAERKLVPLIDVRSAFTSDEYLLGDGLHLSELGHTVYAEVVQRVLDAEIAS